MSEVTWSKFVTHFFYSKRDVHNLHVTCKGLYNTILESTSRKIKYYILENLHGMMMSIFKYKLPRTVIYKYSS